MHEKTSILCTELFIQAVSGSEFSNGKYMRTMNKHDVNSVTKRHKKVHKVSGMLGSIDCTQFFWKNCPMAWAGHFQGKEKKPTIVMEAVADTDLWLWFVSIGLAGSLNDINIWDCSPLHKLMLQDEFERLDFEFTLNGESFQTLYFLANGIYPPLARFVQTFTEPANNSEFNCAE